jgi:hypothetical protein
MNGRNPCPTVKPMVDSSGFYFPVVEMDLLQRARLFFGDWNLGRGARSATPGYVLVLVKVVGGYGAASGEGCGIAAD